MNTTQLNLELNTKLDLRKTSFISGLPSRYKILDFSEYNVPEGTLSEEKPIAYPGGESEETGILHESSNEQIKNTWAFAVDESNFVLRRRQLADLRDYVISSCSKEAKRLGVRAGMRYSEAKALIPDMRILVIGGGNV